MLSGVIGITGDKNEVEKYGEIIECDDKKFL